MQNCLVHRLISTKPCCTLPKYMSVQKYIVNLDLHVRCQPQKYYTNIHPCPCAPPVYVRWQPTWKKCCRTPYYEKWIRWPLLLTDIGPPCAPRCIAQVGNAQFSPVPTKWVALTNPDTQTKVEAWEPTVHEHRWDNLDQSLAGAPLELASTFYPIFINILSRATSTGAPVFGGMRTYGGLK